MRWFDLAWRLGQLSLGRLAHQFDVWRWQLFQSLVCLLLAAVCGLAVLLLMTALAWLQWGQAHGLQVLSGLLLLYALMGWWFMRRAARWLGVSVVSPTPQACAAGGGCSACGAGANRASR
ncbi:MAG: hypothetical protein FGM44_02345 [Limnohabitans sp.]|jgi:hypothetical protein|nr:hypothetical protein [Limnohabitans sp.]